MESFLFVTSFFWSNYILAPRRQKYNLLLSLNLHFYVRSEVTLNTQAVFCSLLEEVKKYFMKQSCDGFELVELADAITRV